MQEPWFYFIHILDIHSKIRPRMPPLVIPEKYDDKQLHEYYKNLNKYYMKNPERASMQMEIMAECECSDTSESEYSTSDEEYWSD